MADKRPSPIRTDIPHSARIWNYWLGGSDFYEVDRLAGEAGVAAYPQIEAMAKQSRQFLIRAVRYLAAEAGIRQFLDIGTGLPTMQNTHEVAQAAAPDARIVYVDNDPLVLAHARALLVNTTDEGVTTYLEADFHEPERILADARNVLNFRQPIAVMFIGVLGHAQTYAEVRRVVDTMMDGVPPGSYLALYDGSTDDAAYVRMCRNYTRTGGVPYNPRTSDEIRGVFDGLELVEPGVVPINHWLGDPGETPTSAWGGVGRKP
ncbi:SAM-dependent methyltransferase [Nocardia puris]|uniref:S-adenosyl methyltransferase n=1 Tax=Nocardia puris TaxID=208602 RepID=A0A366DUA6_9NOCA|nr:SAM-dependent methyltransferase [Nocardia puris]MBF6210255.1 SAM-dependent methyltransferase [Nocardia puris]MBF6367331.1 SAM-dependent methyltransferase [Nocardia puris]MBF6457516.1 SAM-dependent methyltransferase [Nocardia puris]RBO93673.1 S-adenosyl methyltransferase [Nocardia puris]